jgi:hypothetical protein
MALLPHQQTILTLAFDPRVAAHFDAGLIWRTIVYSAIKKSGKTAIAGLVARWVTETWGPFNEVYSIANDKEQARGRVYARAIQSIELDPRYNASAKGIPGYWRIIEREAKHEPSGSVLRTVSSDYRGEAGANPTATLWSELWGYVHEASRRLWDEMTTVPTRPRSFRFVETYAGFEGESTILNGVYERATSPDRGAYRLSKADLHDLETTLKIPLPWPFDDDPLPIYVNPSARTLAYWDDDPERTGKSRRMPWQTSEYYRGEAAELLPSTFDRLHYNLWVSPVSAFIPVEWWTACRVDLTTPEFGPLPPLRRDEPVIMAADASVSGDCTGLVLVGRDPRPGRPNKTVARKAAVWTPPSGGKINYNATLKPQVRDWCDRYNVVEFAYDQYQLHDFATTLRDEGTVWVRSFSQGDERLVSDFGLFCAIRDGEITDDTQSTELAEHLVNSAARVERNSTTKLRIVKKAEDKHIDLAVCLSMGRAECLRLNL